MVVKPMDESLSNIPSLPKRRLLISETSMSGINVSPGVISPLPELEPAKPPQEIEDVRAMSVEQDFVDKETLRRSSFTSPSSST